MLHCLKEATVHGLRRTRLGEREQTFQLAGGRSRGKAGGTGQLGNLLLISSLGEAALVGSQEGVIAVHGGLTGEKLEAGNAAQ